MAVDWFKIYPDAFREETYGMTLAEVGAYGLLLNEYAIQERPLPNHDRALASFCFSDLKEWLEVKDNVLKHFFVDGGVIRHEGMDYQIANQRHRKRNDEHIPWKIRLAVFRRDGFVCRYCGSSLGDFECDHVIPVSRGGETSVENIVVACRPCNGSKGNKLLVEWHP